MLYLKVLVENDLLIKIPIINHIVYSYIFINFIVNFVANKKIVFCIKNCRDSSILR